jgi:DNA repair exonuclease SbcCD nuclease subunit
MHKIAFITDLHYGVRQNSELFLQMQDKFMYDEFIKYVVDNKIEYVVIGGDVFDCRASVNVKVFNHVYKLFEALEEINIPVYVIVGNHDLYLTNSNEYSSMKFLKNFKNAVLIEEPTVIKFDANTDILMTPWVIDKDKFINKYNGCGVKTCIGHFEIVGFPMSGGKLNESGIPSEFFDKNFHTTFSGHFHVESIRGRVIYPNNPFQFTRSDMFDYSKGFSILTFGDDGYWKDIEKIKSKNIIRFEKVSYPEEVDASKIAGNLVDVYVDYGNNFNEDKFKEYLDKINSFKPADNPEIKIINNNVINLNNNINISNLGSSLGLMHEYLDLQNIENKPEVKSLMVELFEESNGVE